MLVCRCCLTFEDNLYSFTEYRAAFRECTGLKVESTAMICPTCIRKLTEAFAFRELSLQSDQFLKEKAAGGGGIVKIKSEPIDPDDVAGSSFAADFEPLVKMEEENMNEHFFDDDYGDNNDEYEPPPTINVMIPEVKHHRKKKKEKNFDSPESLANSIRAKLAWASGTKENLIKECPYCFLSGLRKIDLKKHVMEHVVANGGYECDHCGKKFKQKKVLKGHLFRVYLGIKKTGPTTHVCTECQEVFPEFKLLRKHFKEYHPDLPAPEQHTAGPFLCVECGKELSSKHCLQMHEMTHTGSRPHICPTCGHGYRTKEQLKNHELMHTGELPYLCIICGLGFRSKQTMKNHVNNTHSDEPVQKRKYNKSKEKVNQVFACDFCGKEFKARTLLKSHLISHDDAMRHTCEICGMKFKRASNWRLHKSTHSEQRDFGCGDCGTAFKRRYALKRHMGQHAFKMGLHETSFEIRKGSPASGFKFEGFVIQGPPRYTNPPIVSSPAYSNPPLASPAFSNPPLASPAYSNAPVTTSPGYTI